MKYINLKEFNTLKNIDYRHYQLVDIMNPKDELNPIETKERIQVLNRLMSRIQRDYDKLPLLEQEYTLLTELMKALESKP
ncbi:MAG: hypothetical protein OXE77_11865 [Flavobacteriaceae bacterium]|nr:hypothetical protein [Flavobacteriaceae bacterium]